MNPLLKTFETPYQTTPFSKIKNEHFKPAFKEAIKTGKSEIDAIVQNPEVPSFENTVAALDYCGQLLGKVSRVFFNLNSAETSDEIQSIAKDISPWLSEFYNDIGLNKELFERIKEVHDKKKHIELSPEEETLLEKTYKGFVRNGALLNESDKEKLRNIDKELAQVSLKFGENVLAANNKFELHLTNEKDLAGLPDGIREAGKITASQRKKEGWIFTLDYPSYFPFMTYSDKRELRKKMAVASGSKTMKGDQLDNQQNVLRIVKLRHERAQLLGYSNHAEFVLEEQMASAPDRVNDFLNDLLRKSMPAAKEENTKLNDFSKKIEGPETIESWDSAYYTEKLKQKLFELDDEKLKPYFKLENVREGAFKVANRLYGLSFTEIFDIDKYHEDVVTYKVTDENDNFIAIFYADYHPRPGKRDGAWMTSLSDQFIKDGVNNRPHIVNVCNFTKPTETKPSLLTFNEVTTLFHEFGHALHGILANTVFPSLSGTSVYRDFVELPSQILENWCYEKETLELFAFHYKTNEVIPIELIEKIKSSANYMEATRTIRQLGFGMTDMAWHTSDPKVIESVEEFEVQSMNPARIYSHIDGTSISTSFSHIFQGGYAAGYYSYKWAEVLDADAFTKFKDNGIFNSTIGKSFKDHILSKGGSEHPMKLYKRFMGRQPNNNALLKRAGLLNEDSKTKPVTT